MCSECFGFNHFYVQSPSNPLIEDYTEIFYMTDEGDTLYTQCKMSLRGPMSMRTVDGLSLIFIGFYVSVLTTRLNSNETSPQLCENIILFAVYNIYTGAISKET
jgi:hypothetical protein